MIPSDGISVRLLRPFRFALKTRRASDSVVVVKRQKINNNKRRSLAEGAGCARQYLADNLIANPTSTGSDYNETYTFVVVRYASRKRCRRGRSLKRRPRKAVKIKRTASGEIMRKRRVVNRPTPPTPWGPPLLFIIRCAENAFPAPSCSSNMHKHAVYRARMSFSRTYGFFGNPTGQTEIYGPVGEQREENKRVE